METKETLFTGFKMNGFAMLFIIALLLGVSIASFFLIARPNGFTVTAGLLGILISMLFIPGFNRLEPNEARTMVFFGKYKGTFKETGFFWMNPFLDAKKLSLRARNLDIEPIKVNDKIGNPILIGLVLVWKLKDTYKAMFEIDSQTMANVATGSNAVASRMNAFENFVMIQSDAALRQVAGQYAYDDSESNVEELTLRSGVKKSTNNWSKNSTNGSLWQEWRLLKLVSTTLPMLPKLLQSCYAVNKRQPLSVQEKK